MRRDNWDELEMDEYSAIKIICDEDKYDFYCNLDNKYLTVEKTVQGANPVYLEGVFNTALVVLSMSVIKHYEEANQKVQFDDEKIDIPEAVERVSKALAPTIIPIIKELSKVDSFEDEQ